MILKIECGFRNKNIDVFHNISILELKQQIANLFELTPENFDLKYAQVFLMDSKRLPIYEITESAVVKVVNQKINLKIIKRDSEILLNQLDINMRVRDLKKQYSPDNWENLKFYYFYEYSVDNPNKKKVDMKVVDEIINPKSRTTEQKKEELRIKYLQKYHGDRLYYFMFIDLKENDLTLAQHYMNDNYKIYITFRVFIKHSGSVYSFDVFDELWISYFKILIKEKIDKSMLDFEIIYNDITLNDGNVISDYEISPNDTLITTSTIIGGV